MKKLCLIIIGLLIGLSSAGQSEHLYLYKLPDKTKKKKIKLNREVSFRMNMQTEGDLRTWDMVRGELISADKNHITVMVKKEEKHSSETSDTMITNSSRVVNYKDTLEGYQQIRYAKDNIEYIDYRWNNDKLETAGTVGLILSSITTFVVAPLVSIDYKNGTFNSNTYRNWALAGTAGMAVSIPILVVSGKYRWFVIKQGPEDHYKPAWSFDK